MADRTLTVNGQPFTFNRDRFAGVRTMEVSQPLADSTTKIKLAITAVDDNGVSMAGFSGVYTRSSTTSSVWNQEGGDGALSADSINTNVNGSSVGWILEDSSDNDPYINITVSNLPVTTFSKALPWDGLSAFVSAGIVITPAPEIVTVDRTAQVIDSDRKGESRPLLSKVVGGAAAAYSLRDLNDKAGNNKVVRVRRVSDNNEREFLAKEVANGTLEAFANESVKYLDSTGTTTKNVTTNGITFPVVGSSDYLANNLSFSATGGFNNTEKYSFTGSGDSHGFGHNWYFSNAFNVNRIGSSAPNKTVTVEAYVKRTSGSSSDNLYFRPYATSTSNKITVTGLVQDEWTFVKGTLIKDSSVAIRTHIQIGGDTGVTFEVSNIKFYSENNDVKVSKWYDQSGNSKDAVQLTATNQPKIVSAGTFLSELLFEGSQVFDSITLSASAQPNSIVTVSNTNVASQTHGIYGTNTNQAGYYRSSNKHAIYSTGTGSATLEGAAYVVDRDYLRFDLFNGTSSVIGVDGTTASGTTGVDGLTRLDIGDSSLSGVNPLNGGIKELILYTSNQSANRPAIEANINNQYDIY